MNYQQFIKSSLEDASEVANNKYGKVSGTTKKDDNNQVLTEADIEIGQLIIKKIEKEFPNHNIIDEEAGVIDKKSEFTWVVDPIDGTNNYAVGVPTYGIMIGLLLNNQPIAGGIALPFFSEIIIAEKEKGAYLGDKKLSVTSEKDLSKVLVAYGMNSYPQEPEKTRNEAKLYGEIRLNIGAIRSSNSVFDSVMVAKGNYGAFLNQSSMIWDNVAQQIVIEEAGGIYTDFDGNPMDYSNPLEKAKENFKFIAASPSIHKQLLEVIKSVG